MLYKTALKKNWTKLFDIDLNFKDSVLQIMKKYMIKTEGSKIEEKDYSISWKYSPSQQEFGLNQAEELFKELQNLHEFHNEIEILSHDYQIEVKPRYIDKGIFLELLLQKQFEQRGEIECVLIIGESKKDEKMFESLNKFKKENPKYFSKVYFNYLFFFK